MKRLLSAFLCLMMIVSVTTPIKAAGNSIEKLSSGQQIENVSKSYEIIYKDELARVFYGSNGIDIVCKDETVHFKTNFPVLKLLPIDDVNGDGFVDFAITQKSPDLADNLFVIDGQNGEVLHSTCITRGTVEDGDYIIANTYALMMKASGSIVYDVYDYTVLAYDCATGEKVFEYVNEDNIWDIELIEGQVCFVDQLGRIGFVDGYTGELISVNKISNNYQVPLRWDEGTILDYTMNLWDIYYENGMIYVTTEDGYLLMVDPSGAVIADYFLDDFKIEDFTNVLADNVDWNNSTITAKITGLLDPNFKSFKIIDSNEKYLLIGCYFIDEECGMKNMNYYSYQGVSVFDKETNEVFNIKSNNPDSTGLAACLDVYEGKDAVVIVKSDSKESTKLEIKALDGSQLYQKNVGIVNSEQSPTLTIERKDDSYFVESYGACSVMMDKSFKITYLFETTTVELKYIGDSITYLYSLNGRSKKLVNLNKDCETVNWEYEIPYSTSNKGIEYMLVEDYNYDGVVDYICLIQNYDKNDSNTSTTFLIISGANGNKLVEKKIVEYQAYDSKGKKYNVYLTASDVSLIADKNKDKKKELVVNNYIISSSSFTLKGNIDTYINAKGSQIGIGDINGDGIEDYMMLTSTSAVAYYSSMKDYNVSYKKSNYSASLNKNNKSNENYKIIGDINSDGAKEIAFASTNSEGYQTFDIYNGKNLKKLFTLCPNGVSWYESIAILDFDLDGDGYNELLHYSDSYGFNGVINGKTGEVYKYFDLWQKDDIDIEQVGFGEIYHPDFNIELNVQEDTAFSFVKFKDITGDGKSEYALVKHYPDEKTWMTKSSIFIYDGNDLSYVKEIPIEVTDFYGNVSAVDGDDSLMVLTGDEKVILQNVDTEETIASFAIKAKSFTKVNENTVLAMDEEKNLFLLNTEKGFELLTAVDESIEGHTLHFEWKNNADYSIMTITDNNEVIYRGSQQEVDVRFTEGEHTLIFDLDDGQGKSTVKTIKFTVAKQQNKQLYLLGVGGVLLVLAIFLNMRRKNYIAKKVKGGLK